MLGSTKTPLLWFATTFICLVHPVSSAPPGLEGCFTIVVGKEASVDGSVLMAHNEDDSPPQLVNHHKIPRIVHREGEKVRLLNGGQLDQVGETWSYLWSEMPGMKFSDSYVNEWGVTIASNNCPSREDIPELTDGGISYNLRGLVAQRAKSAREGVKLAGELVERFGYDASGRTYTICDPDEGWLFCAVNGRHWVAQRVPDDAVAMIANTYTIQMIDLADSANSLGSADIVDYAISRGWYDPEGERPFDFAAAFANPRADLDSSNFCRWWSGLRHVMAEPIPLNRELPFAVKPMRKLDVRAVQEILRDHYEGTVLHQRSNETGSPHESYLHTICGWTTQTSFIAQLRRNMPASVGICYWVTYGPPCTSPYIPFYFGLAEFPEGYSGGRDTPTEDVYSLKVTSPFAVDHQQAFYMFSNFHDKIDRSYSAMIGEVRAYLSSLEDRALAMQPLLEQVAVENFATDSLAVKELLTNFSGGMYLSAMNGMQKILEGQ